MKVKQSISSTLLLALLLVLSTMTTTTLYCQGFSLHSFSSQRGTTTTTRLLVSLTDHNNKNNQNERSSSSSSSSSPTIEFVDPKTNCRVVLLGCFHGTQSSARDVEEAIADDTDVVALELCETRFADLVSWMEKDQGNNNNNNNNSYNNNQNEETTNKRDERQKLPWAVAYWNMIQSTMEQRGLATGLAFAVLGGFSSMQTALTGFTPGLEFTTALQRSKEIQENNQQHQQQQQHGCEIALVDQQVDETLRKVGSLPQLSWTMLTSPNPIDEWKVQAQSWWRAVFGEEQNPKTPQLVLTSVLVRNWAAFQDLVRLTVPPTLLYGFFMSRLLASSSSSSLSSASASSSVQEQLLSTNTDDAIAAAIEPTMLLDMIPHWCASLLILSFFYLGIALPAVKVIVTERDDILTQGIQEACQKAGEGGKVVAVLGMLHINGVAKRMLSEDNNNKNNNNGKLRP